MGEQLDIFGGPRVTSEMTRSEQIAKRRAAKPSIDQRWAEFHTANPHVFEELLRLARARLARGETRIGVKALWEELRQTLAKRDLAYDADFGAYKLNNDFTSLYARTLIRVEPALAPLIEVRHRKAKK